MSTRRRDIAGVARRRHPPGTAPGVVRPPAEAAVSRVTLIRYGGDAYVERELPALEALDEYALHDGVTWVNVDGLADAALIVALGRRFGLHDLALEDVVNVHQRPKLERYGDHLFVVMRMPHPGTAFDAEQVSLFIGDGFVLSFQERDGDCFDAVRGRIREQRGRLWQSRSDYLGYALLDAITDSYFPVLEAYGERLDAIEERVLDGADIDATREIHLVRRELLAIRRAVWPMREVFNTFARGDLPEVTDTTLPYLRDCYDHVSQLIDIIEIYREVATGLVETHLSSVSMRTNEIMKVLTIIATIFIPLGTIAGIYGMNFDPEASPWNMPELSWRFGYPFALGVMAAVAGGLLLWFHRRGWLGGRRRRGR